MRNKTIAAACAVTLDFVEIQGNATRAELAEYLQMYPEFGGITLCDILCALLENNALVHVTSFSGMFYYRVP